MAASSKGYLVGLVLRAIGVLAMLQAPATADETKVDMQDLISKIVASENATHQINVGHFRGQLFISDSAGKFVPTKRCSEGSVVYDGSLGGRFLATLDHDAIPVSGGGNKWFDRSLWQSFNGSAGKTIYGNVAHLSPTTLPDGLSSGSRVVRQAWLSAASQRQDLVTFESLCDGSSASIGFFQGFLQAKNEAIPLLGESLAGLLKEKFVPTAVVEAYHGRNVVRVDDTAGGIYRLDPDLNYAIIYAETKVSSPRASPFHKLVVEKLSRLANGNWYATKGYWQKYPDERPDNERVEFAADNVQSDASPGCSYDATIPAGYLVDDQIHGGTFIEGGSDEELNTHLKILSDEAKRETGTLAPVVGVSGPQESFLPITVRFFVAFLVIGVTLVVVKRVLQRRARRRSG